MTHEIQVVVRNPTTDYVVTSSFTDMRDAVAHARKVFALGFNAWVWDTLQEEPVLVLERKKS